MGSWGSYIPPRVSARRSSGGGPTRRISLPCGRARGPVRACSAGWDHWIHRKKEVGGSMTESNQPPMLLDPYGAWARAENIPITEDFGVDLLATPTAPWPRLGAEGGIVHVKGRGDFVAIFVIDLAAGAKTAPQRHLYEEVVYVLSGYGSTTVETSDGRTHSFEWGPKSLFALPLNTRYRHFNGSGWERARLSVTTKLPLLLNLFRNETFIF